VSLSYWFTVIDPYVKNKQVYVCPTAGVVGASNSSKGYGWNIRGTLAAGNGFGYYIGSLGTPTGSALNLAAVDEPSTTILITDPSSNNNTSTGGYYAVGYSTMGYIPVLHGGQVGPFYDTGIASGTAPVAPGGGGNYLFADGHVKWMSASQSYCSIMWDVSKSKALSAPNSQSCGVLKQ
jgi:prepilin-type processing-associated H-X9-DG protein